MIHHGRKKYDYNLTAEISHIHPVCLEILRHFLQKQGNSVSAVQASLEFRSFNICGFEFSRFIISPNLLYLV